MPNIADRVVKALRKEVRVLRERSPIYQMVANWMEEHETELAAHLTLKACRQGLGKAIFSIVSELAEAYFYASIYHHTSKPEDVLYWAIVRHRGGDNTSYAPEAEFFLTLNVNESKGDGRPASYWVDMDRKVEEHVAQILAQRVEEGLDLPYLEEEVADSLDFYSKQVVEDLTMALSELYMRAEDKDGNRILEAVEAVVDLLNTVGEQWQGIPEEEKDREALHDFLERVKGAIYSSSNVGEFLAKMDHLYALAREKGLIG